MTEGAPFCLNPYDGERKLLSVGNPVPETEIEIVDLETGERVVPLGERGEVRVRGPQIMLRLPQQARGNGRSAARRLAIHRRHRLRRRRRLRVISSTARRTWSSSAATTCIRARWTRCCSSTRRYARRRRSAGRTAGWARCSWRSSLLDAGAALTEAEIFEYCKVEMVKYKRPVEVRFVDALPKTGTNKINRRALREWL